MEWENNLFNRIKKIQNDTSLHDFGGGSPLSKCYVMAYLATYFKLKNYVEIGVYKGRSLFSVGQAFKDNEGSVFGIDPYSNAEAVQLDLEENFKHKLNSFLESVDFDAMYANVLSNTEKFGLSQVAQIIRKASTSAVKDFQNITIDMLHIDGNHDLKNVQADIKNYTPLVSDGGIIVINVIQWDSVKQCYEPLKKDYIVLLETDYLGILMKKDKTQKNLDDAEIVSRKLKNLYVKLLEIEDKNSIEKPNVNVGVLAYNQEKYIVECLNSIVSQKGNFNLNIIICEDHSTDQTSTVIETYLKNTVLGENITIEYLKSKENLGMVKNLKRLLRACRGSMYTALMDGDDYWVDDSKIQTHIKFMESHPECAISFDSIVIYYPDEKREEAYTMQQEAKGNIFTTEYIISQYIIGNISCCFYFGKYLDDMPDQFFEMFVGDWMLNIYYSQFGDIGFVRSVMTVYRKHSNGIWTGLDDYERNMITIKCIDDYNRFLNYKYDEGFSYNRQSLTYRVDNRYFESCDLVIADNVFPHPKSESKYQEFVSYLENFNSIKILTTGFSIHAFGKETLNELFVDFKRKFPQYDNKVETFVKIDGKLYQYDALFKIDCKLLYLVSVFEYAYYYIELAEVRGIPYILTLYPDSSFEMGTVSTDTRLKRILQSPFFRKVIITQKAFYDYLIKQNFCTPEKIVYIFGGVVPKDKLKKTYKNKAHFGIDKNILDICYVPYSTVESEKIKGYELFIEVAKKMTILHNNIHFHVVGNFNPVVSAELKDRITFYTETTHDWIDTFYQDKDIILSTENLSLGSSECFPNKNCLDSGLCQTAIFTTDLFGLNDAHFKDRSEIVIISHDPSKIVETIDYYYMHPKDLKVICENGCKAIKSLYSIEKQITPRIKLLKENIK